MKLNNKYYIMRHGQAMSNVKDIVSCMPEKFENLLTDVGKEAIRASAGKLINKKINLIIASPLLRTKQTSEIVGELLGVTPEFDERLREIGFGIYNSEPAKEFDKYFQNREQRVKMGAPEGGESYTDVFERVISLFEETNKKYKNKNILIISHQAPLFLLEGHLKGFSILKTVQEFPRERMLRVAEMRELN